MKFGLRIKKTVLAVALCLVVDHFRQGMPLFSVIAAIMTLQKDRQLSLVQARNRISGTLIGGALGLASLIVFQKLNISYQSLIYILAVSFMAVPIININLWLNSPKSAAFSCVVYYSVVISHFKDLEPFVFVSNRMIDTLIGVLVGLLLNLLPYQDELEDPRAG